MCKFSRPSSAAIRVNPDGVYTLNREMPFIRKPSAITSSGIIVTTRDLSVLPLRLAKSAKIAHYGADKRPITAPKTT